MNKLLYLIKKLSARFHLRFSCPRCPEKKRKSRDIFNKGECFWYSNWVKGNYKIRSYFSYRLFKALNIKKGLRLR